MEVERGNNDDDGAVALLFSRLIIENSREDNLPGIGVEQACRVRFGGLRHTCVVSLESFASGF